MEFEISLNHLIFYSYHGVLEEERITGNEFKVDLTVIISVEEKHKNDSVEDTISYANLYEIIKEEMNRPRKLLETLLLSIVERIKKEYPEIIKGKLRIEKVHPPIQGMLGTASVAINF